jgi:hypothetical protein
MWTSTSVAYDQTASRRGGPVGARNGQEALERLRAWCPTCREPLGSCQRCSGRRGRTSPSSRAGEPLPPGASIVLLAGRATSVPFTAVLNGSQWTTTDNTSAASTCAVPHPRRSQQRPIWLWEQGVDIPTQLSNYLRLRNSEHNDNRSPRDHRGGADATPAAYPIGCMSRSWRPLACTSSSGPSPGRRSSTTGSRCRTRSPRSWPPSRAGWSACLHPLVAQLGPRRPVRNNGHRRSNSRNCMA